MKKLLYIISLLLTFGTLKAQTTYPLTQWDSVRVNNLTSLKAILSPVVKLVATDTTGYPASSYKGAILYRGVDNTIYSSNGAFWTKLGVEYILSGIGRTINLTSSLGTQSYTIPHDSLSRTGSTLSILGSNSTILDSTAIFPNWWSLVRSQISGTNGVLYNPVTGVSQVDSTKYAVNDFHNLTTDTVLKIIGGAGKLWKDTLKLGIDPRFLVTDTSFVDTTSLVLKLNGFAGYVVDSIKGSWRTISLKTDTTIGSSYTVPHDSLSLVGNQLSILNSNSITLPPPGTGTVTNVSSGSLTNFATVSVANQTTTPAFTFSLLSAPAHSYFGNNTGTSAAPNYFQPDTSDVNNFFLKVRGEISLTTTGSSGASTYNNVTGILNVPAYTLAGLGGQPAGSYALTNGSNATGTWPISITGNAVSANELKGVTTDTYSGNTLSTAPATILGIDPTTGIYKYTASAIQSFLGLGSNAYTSTAYLPLTGGTLTGNLTLRNILTIDTTGSTGFNYIVLNQNNTGTAHLTIQAGAGSNSYGGAINLYGNASVTNPGSVIAGLSNSSSKFSVNQLGLGGGTDIFKVDYSGNTTLNGTLSTLSLISAPFVATNSSGTFTAAAYTPYNPSSYPVNAGGETLGSVTLRNNTTNNIITVTGFNEPVTSGIIGLRFYYDSTGRYTGYQNERGGFIVPYNFSNNTTPKLHLYGGGGSISVNDLLVSSSGLSLFDKNGVTQASIDSVGDGTFNGILKGINITASGTGGWTMGNVPNVARIHYGIAEQNAFAILTPGNSYANLYADTVTLAGPITSTKFITSGGTASQHVNGDGSLDGTAYTPTNGTGASGSWNINSVGLSGYSLSNIIYLDYSGSFLKLRVNGTDFGTNIPANITGNSATSNQVNNAITFNNSGSGASSGVTYDGSAAQTISYNTIGAAPASASANYIQNTTTQQASANFNIAGFGQIRDSLFVGSPLYHGNMFKVTNDTMHIFQIGNQIAPAPGEFSNYFGTMMANDHGILVTADTNTAKTGYGAQGMLIINGRAWNSAHGTVAEIGMRAGDSIGDREMEMTVGYDMGEVTTDNGYSITRWYGTNSSQGASQMIQLLGDSTAFTYGFRNYTSGMVWNPYRTDNNFLHLITGNILLDAGNISTNGVLTAISVKTANYTLTSSDRTVIDNASGAITFTLPTAASVHNQEYVLSNVSASALTLSIAVNALAGGTTTTVAAHSSMTIQSDGTNYWQTK